MRRDEVFKAMRFGGPERVPIYFFNRDQDQSDIVALDVQHHFLISPRPIRMGIPLESSRRDNGTTNLVLNRGLA